MKLKNFLFIVFVVFQVYNCNNRSEQNKVIKWTEESIKTNIGFSKKIINFGKLSSDTIVKAILYIKNIGVNDLVIKEVSPECNCTEYKLDNDTIPIGDSTRLEIDFNTEGKGLGLQSKAIVIRSNTDKEYNTLIIKCNIAKKKS